MSPEETLQYESRVRVREAAIAVAAAVLLMVAAVLALTGPQPKVAETTIVLLSIAKRGMLDVLASVVDALGFLTAAWTLVYVHGRSRARDPEKASPWVKYCAIAGGLLSAISGIVYRIVYLDRAHQFVHSGSQTYYEASHLTTGLGLYGPELAGLAGALLLAVSFVMVSLQAMNVGLLTRFVGYLGMFAGALVLFGVFPIPIVQCYWLVAIACLAYGWWPSTIPPAWRTGRAEPWPSSAEMRTRRAAEVAARRGGRGGRGGRGAPVPAPAAEAAGPAPVVEGRTRSSTPKRKRKRRS